MKTISLEGKWKNLRNLVSQLEEQGWTVVSCEGDAEFRYTTVELVNES